MVVFPTHKVFELCKPYVSDVPIIVEAGAFDGRDTQKIAATWPHGMVHAFEPVPELFERLCFNTAHLPNVRCYQLALSDHAGTAIFYVSEKPGKTGTPSQAGSLREPKERLSWSPIQFPRTITVNTITLDAWAAEHNIKTIDMLWLDMQGHELSVLQAAPQVLASVSVVYAEVGFIEAYAQQPRYEVVKAWIEKHNFSEIGRTFADQHSWFFGNVLWVKKQ